MKNFILAFVLCAVTNVNADMYKCVSGDKISYQSSPCPNEEDENEFLLKYDLSKEQIQVARDNKAAELAAVNEQKRLDRLAYDRERMIRAEENKAREAALQTDAMMERNNIERERRVYIDRRVYVGHLGKYRPGRQSHKRESQEGSDKTMSPSSLNGVEPPNQSPRAAAGRLMFKK